VLTINTVRGAGVQLRAEHLRRLLAGSTGTVSASGSLKTGVAGTWQVDPTQDPPLNAGARRVATDFYAQCAAAGWR